MPASTQMAISFAEGLTTDQALMFASRMVEECAVDRSAHRTAVHRDPAAEFVKLLASDEPPVLDPEVLWDEFIDPVPRDPTAAVEFATLLAYDKSSDAQVFWDDLMETGQ
jgi:hypothetical protein